MSNLTIEELEKTRLVAAAAWDVYTAAVAAAAAADAVTDAAWGVYTAAEATADNAAWGVYTAAADAADAINKKEGV
jgi:hypothetical protein